MQDGESKKSGQCGKIGDWTLQGQLNNDLLKYVDRKGLFCVMMEQ